MFVGTVSSRRVMLLFWMTTTSGLAVVVATEVQWLRQDFLKCSGQEGLHIE